MQSNDHSVIDSLTGQTSEELHMEFIKKAGNQQLCSLDRLPGTKSGRLDEDPRDQRNWAVCLVDSMHGWHLAMKTDENSGREENRTR